MDGRVAWQILPSRLGGCLGWHHHGNERAIPATIPAAISSPALAFTSAISSGPCTQAATWIPPFSAAAAVAAVAATFPTTTLATPADATTLSTTTVAASVPAG